MLQKKIIKYLKPHLYVDSLNEIKLDFLWYTGKRGLIIDLDNTIAPWREEKITAEAHKFITDAVQIGFRVCLLSNASHKRVKKAANKYDIPYVASAMKPISKSFIRANQCLGLNPEQVVVIGDQLFTDVLGGNRVGCHTILVKPLNTFEFAGTRIIRKLEKIAFKIYGKQVQ